MNSNMLSCKKNIWIFVYSLSTIIFCRVSAYSDTIIPGGRVSGTWESAGSPYLIQGEIVVDNNDLLMIQPGVEVIFQGHYKFIVNGYLLAQGAEGDSILITAENPDTGWQGLRFINAPDSSVLEYCIFMHGRAITGPDISGGGVSCDNSNPIISHCLFLSNWAQLHGAGLFSTHSSPKISDCVFQDNIAHNYQGAKGGGVGFEFSDIVIRNCIFRNNYAGDDGGAIYSYESESVISNCQVMNNSCIEWGGGICNGWDSNMTLRDCVISGNIGGDGGGIYFFDSDASIDNCLIRENFTEGGNPPYSHNNGGGIFMGYNAGSDGSNLTLTNSIIERNSALGGGGGIYAGYLCSMYVHDSSITGNSANSSGGGIHSSSSGLNTILSRVRIEENSAGGSGGGIFSQTASIKLYKCIVAANSSDNLGGGCATNSIESYFKNCTFYGNSSQLTGSAFYFYYIPVNVSNCIIAENQGFSAIHLANTGDTNIHFSGFYGNQGHNFSGTPIPPGIGNYTTVNFNGDSCDVYSNIYIDPLFADPAGGDFHITQDSPCIDAGDPHFRLDPDSTISDIGALFHYQMENLGAETNEKSSIDFNIPDVYPNPFNPTTTISFDLPEAGKVSLIVYDIQGREVKRLVDGVSPAGSYQAVFDGSELSSGVYFARMEAGDFRQTRKMLLLK